MSIWLDRKYMTMLPLQGFVRKNHGNWEGNCRCPKCGDSKIKTSKKRGWFSSNGIRIKFHCFNCGYDGSLEKFIKTFFYSYYADYRKEKLIELYGDKSRPVKEDTFNPFKVETNQLDLSRIRDLPINHQVVKYIKNRKIPLEWCLDFYYSDNFYEWCKGKQPEIFKEEMDSDKRLVFPFKDRSGNIFGLSGRSIEYKEPKYITIKLDGDYPKVFGYDKLDLHKPVYVTEGQIDSLFVDNCIGVIGAMGGLNSVCEFCNLHDKKKVILIPDNERRSKETCRFIKKNLENGYSVFLWPEKYKVKDLNDLVEKYGLTREELKCMIDENVVSGMGGLIKFSNWRR